ncbi:MAG: hypothetical protein RM022_019510 [Nostoc sp. EfeVER01]|uniref:hypothetical protein n=1 Tax=unclassified Nostoc TaxID=2593658 RepID=UPI002AD40552|nr:MULTISPECIES: hypothetical protein [unclassified Nostoc]MDZ7946861.1 hypothetical protein [Nostoc sp. EfeVER01]MDZ7992855.1 hypothetical protein [Nostoc sp. EspVER01]
MTLKLFSKEDALKCIAQIGKNGEPFEISLGEDICFGRGKWVNVGTITLQPGGQYIENETRYDEYCAAKFGGFEWQILSLEKLNNNITEALENSQSKDRVQKAFREGLQDVLRRTLLLLPIFDVETIGKIPLQKPITIVTDTSAIHQGGLDFICRFLSPWAKIKVPAIVHMEIINQVDRYFATRRESQKKKKPVAAALREHILSQGGQRTLLRLEFSDAEIERGDLGADPLRGIVTPSSDPEDGNLKLQEIVRSFADRLILETARRFQTQVRPDHALALLTSDQGLARMTMAEGMDVFFFESRSFPKFDSRKLTGSLFHPFSQKIYTVPLTDVLWELAVSFGCLRLQNYNTNESLELWGIPSGEYTWQPLHVKNDLLWGIFNSGTSSTTDNTSIALSSDIESSGHTDAVSSENIEKTAIAKAYAFSPDQMLLLMKMLVDKGELTNQEAQDKLGLKHQERYNLYKNFLKSGSFVEINDSKIICTELLKSLWQSVLDEDHIKFLSYLKKVPSFEALHNHVNQGKTVEYSTLPILNNAKSTYIKLGEAACAWLNIQNKKIVATDNIPDIPDFANLAVEVYKFIRSQEDTEWILTGRWLEELAIKYAVHPILARKLVKKAQEQNLVNVYAEGSTPDTRFEQHDLWIIKTSDGLPQLEKVYLYHGDFLIPGTSAVRIKLEGVKNAS